MNGMTLDHGTLIGIAVFRTGTHDPVPDLFEMRSNDIKAAFEAFIRSERFPCVGAKAALVRDTMTMIEADDIDSPKSDLKIHAALQEFGHALDPDAAFVQSFVVVFHGPKDLSEARFEKALWNRLQSLHNLDVITGEPWSADVAADPRSAHFSMSIGTTPYFVVGLHPNASRPARRFACPVMVFNSHDQFERLREDGRYDKMKLIIRKRDAALSGGINPMLDDFGAASEARQYSGRRVESDWQCPFEAQGLESSD